jgi:aryl-alcohol dehydrogenase-like predicted oxidoreductase
LGIKHIDLYQLHWPSYEVPIEETMKAMEELVSRGKIRYVGIRQLFRRTDVKGEGCHAEV